MAAREAKTVLRDAAPPLRSTIEPAPTTRAPAGPATAIVSRVEPPVVTTSSMTRTRSVGASVKRRSVSLPSCRSANVARTPRARATSWPIISSQAPATTRPSARWTRTSRRGRGRALRHASDAGGRGPTACSPGLDVSCPSKQGAVLTEEGQNGFGIHRVKKDSPKPQASPPMPVYSPRGAEAVRHGHHAERGGPHRGVPGVGRLGRRDAGRRQRQHRRHAWHRAGAGRCVVRDWPGYSAQKNFAAVQAAHDWILSLDADERVTPELAEEIRAHRSQRDAAAAGFRIPRVTWHLGPLDPHHRLVSRLPAAALRPPARRAGPAAYVHESVTADGPVGAARARSAALRLSRHRASSRDDGSLHDAGGRSRCSTDGRRAGVVDLAVHPPPAFLRNYVLRGGFRDGVAGLHHLGDERVLRVPEVREAVGGHHGPGRRYADRRTGRDDARSTSTRRARGAADRTRSCSRSPACRSSGTRAVLVAHEAGELQPPRAARACASSASRRAASSTCTRPGSSRKIFARRPARRHPRARSDGGRAGRDGAADENARLRAPAAGRRRAARRLPSQAATRSRSGSTGTSTFHRGVAADRRRSSRTTALPRIGSSRP